MGLSVRVPPGRCASHQSDSTAKTRKGVDTAEYGSSNIGRARNIPRHRVHCSYTCGGLLKMRQSCNGVVLAANDCSRDTKNSRQGWMEVAREQP